MLSVQVTQSACQNENKVVEASKADHIYVKVITGISKILAFTFLAPASQEVF